MMQPCSIYRRLLFLYPADYREKFGDEMAWVFGQAQAEIRGEGALARWIFCARATVVLMFMCFLGVVLALDQARMFELH